MEPANGREFTSEDVKYSIERQSTDQAGKFQHAYFFLKRIASIETPDNYTVRVKMNTAYAPFLSYIASPWTMMINRESVEKWGDLTETTIGTGPFIFKEWQKNVKVELDRNPDYQVKELPYVDKLTYLIATDAQVRATLYIDRKIDAIIVGYNELSQVNDKRKSDSAYRAVPSQFWRQFRMPPTLAADSAKGTAAKAARGRRRPRPGSGRARHRFEAGARFRPLRRRCLANGPILPDLPALGAQGQLSTDRPEEGEGTARRGRHERWPPRPSGLGIPGQHGERPDGRSPQAAAEGDRLGSDAPADGHDPLLQQDLRLGLHAGAPRSAQQSRPGRKPLRLLRAQFDLLQVPRRGDLGKDRQAGEDGEHAGAPGARQEIQKDIIAKHPMKFMYTPNNHNFVDKNVQGWFWPTDLYDGRKATAWKKA
ncbi:MAG: hypothetical protein IPG14_17130 [Dehalococcoidia bacterium]|nr:hypothetical protein [Dehalococcoidia bacterium]